MVEHKQPQRGFNPKRFKRGAVELRDIGFRAAVIAVAIPRPGWWLNGVINRRYTNLKGDDLPQ